MNEESLKSAAFNQIWEKVIPRLVQFNLWNVNPKKREKPPYDCLFGVTLIDSENLQPN